MGSRVRPMCIANKGFLREARGGNSGFEEFLLVLQWILIWSWRDLLTLCPLPNRGCSFFFFFFFLSSGLLEAHFIHLNLSSHNGNHVCSGRAFVALDSETLLVATSLPGASHNTLLPPRDRGISPSVIS